MRPILSLLVALAIVGCSQQEKETSAVQSGRSAAPGQATTEEKCEHGVTTALCARCNPALAAAFKAKNDWCVEHERPESQCVICNPELAQLGVK